MKTRIITGAVGLGVLAVVLAFFDTFLFDLVLSAVCLIAIHEVFSAMGFGKKQWYLYAAAVPLTLLVMLSTSQMVRGLLLPAAFLTVLFYNVCQIAHVKTLDFGKLTGFIYFSGVITFCFYSLILCFAWGGDTAAYFAGRAFGRHKLAPIVSPHKTVEGAVGGVLGTMVFGVLVTVIYSIAADRMEEFTRSNIGVSMYVIIALLACVAAVLGIYGDLFASVVKRQCGIKDYGTIFPGHGGILDRFDSVMFIAPFVTMVVIAAFYN